MGKPGVDEIITGRRIAPTYRTNKVFFIGANTSAVGFV